MFWLLFSSVGGFWSLPESILLFLCFSLKVNLSPGFKSLDKKKKKELLQNIFCWFVLIIFQFLLGFFSINILPNKAMDLKPLPFSSSCSTSCSTPCSFSPSSHLPPCLPSPHATPPPASNTFSFTSLLSSSNPSVSFFSSTSSSSSSLLLPHRLFCLHHKGLKIFCRFPAAAQSWLAQGFFYCRRKSLPRPSSGSSSSRRRWFQIPPLYFYI